MRNKQLTIVIYPSKQNTPAKNLILKRTNKNNGSISQTFYYDFRVIAHIFRRRKKKHRTQIQLLILLLCRFFAFLKFFIFRLFVLFLYFDLLIGFDL